MTFNGKVVLVTGGASGIGEATAHLLASQGGAVVVADRDLAGAQRVAAAIEAAGGQALAHGLDLTQPEAVQTLVAAAMQRFGALHGVVNNAGIGQRVHAAVADVSLDDWHAVVQTNLDAVFYVMKYAIPALLASGGGAIVNVASVMGTVAMELSPAYVAAKHGVVGLTKSAALAYAKQGIRVNAVGPGYIDTPLLSRRGTPDYERLAALHPIGRLGRAQEVAELITFLLSEKASFITGSLQLADGGYTAR
ncbi:MAG: SDR family NAD(P)-dependent oxidoreductase [Burkholderiales bacterium]